jgi:N-acyl-phosphatidylethanolamine-hydrolysing phospholipase D
MNGWKRYLHASFLLSPRSMSSNGTAASAVDANTSPSTMLLHDRIAARVQERNSWSTWRKHSVTAVLKFLTTHGSSLPRLPLQSQLDEDFPVLNMEWPALQSPEPLQVTWLGHASCLIQAQGLNILTGPVFSERCSAVQWAGPKRYRPTPCNIRELLKHVRLDTVLLSHNHYDHLDYNTMQDLANLSEFSLTFVVPLGLKQWFESNVSGIDRHEIYELDWHEPCTIVTNSGKKLEVTPVPMQHWTSRHGWDRDQTLWCGYSLVCEDTTKVLFPGDTGWFEGLWEIGERYGPFDVAMIPIGAYEPRSFMKPQHTDPEEAVLMMEAVRARKGLPIHWGTFQLTSEHYLEPRVKLVEAMEKSTLSTETFAPWLIGETVVCPTQ